MDEARQALAERDRRVDALPARSRQQRGCPGHPRGTAPTAQVEVRPEVVPQPRVHLQRGRHGLGRRAGVLRG